MLVVFVCIYTHPAILEVVKGKVEYWFHDSVFGHQHIHFFSYLLHNQSGASFYQDRSQLDHLSGQNLNLFNKSTVNIARSVQILAKETV